jgi:hypothetical protein
VVKAKCTLPPKRTLSLRWSTLLKHARAAAFWSLTGKSGEKAASKSSIPGKVRVVSILVRVITSELRVSITKPEHLLPPLDFLSQRARDLVVDGQRSAGMVEIS